MALSSLLIGILIYYCFRNLDLRLFQWLNVHITIIPAAINQTLVSSFLIYNLPDGLWFLSGILFIRALWLDNPAASKAYILIFCILAVSMEGSQYFNLISGTFDFFDIIAMVLAAFVEGVFYKCLVQRRVWYAN
jgi:hypothetical protein